MDRRQLTADTAQQIPMQGPGRAAIQGLVVNTDNQPVPGADVVLKAGDREVARTTTSGDGVFRLIDVAPGDYSLAVSKDGYALRSQGGLHVSGSELVSVDLTLQSATPPPAGEPIEPDAAHAVRPRRASQARIRTRRRRRCRQTRKCSCACRIAGICRCPSGIGTASPATTRT